MLARRRRGACRARLVGMSRSESMEAIFRVDGDRVIVSPNAAGPWDGGMQHGGAPASLAVWAAERIPTAVPMRIARVSIDLMRPVPLQPLTLESEVLREGRKIQLCAIRLRADGVLCVAATVLKVRLERAALPAGVSGPKLALPLPDASVEDPAQFTNSPFVTGMQLRAARGRFGVPGPGAIWYRIVRPMVEGFGVSQAVRAVVAADFCNGTSAALDFRHWIFLNADLTVNMAREPVGEWILLDAESWIGPEGAGLAMARLADEAGYFGRAVQSLVIEKRE
jgi:acyl-coenzyme A thioesterase PaaI-like protein